MRFEGIHHVTCITGDAPGNVDFYTRVLGLRMVKKTVNQDDPTVYHLFYADEEGSPGADITFFEYPGARRGRAGVGMVHTITFRVASDEALDFWEARLGVEGIATRRSAGRLGFDDPEGLGLELAAVSTTDAPLVARHPEIPAALALQGFDSVRAFAADPEASRRLLEETLGFVPTGTHSWEVRGAVRGGHFAYDPPPASGGGIPGAGTVHHVAFGSNMDEQEAWLDVVRGAGQSPSGIIDRFWFRSIYFREPSGVLFELATMGPGFTIDEEADRLGEALILPPAFEHLREKIEPVLTPLPRSPRGLGRMMIEPLRFLERPASDAPEGALVLLHGRGADERDLFPLLNALDPERRLLGITPRGPLSLPPGGAHWYRLGGIPTPDPDTFFPTFEAAAGFLDALPVPIERVVLGGFSQGAVMSWALGLGSGRPRPAAIVALSGFIPEVEGFELDLADLTGYPIAVAHGSEDPVIAVEFGRMAAERVRAAGADVLWRETRVPHTIDPRVLPELQAFVASALA